MRVSLMYVAILYIFVEWVMKDYLIMQNLGVIWWVDYYIFN